MSERNQRGEPAQAKVPLSYSTPVTFTDPTFAIYRETMRQRAARVSLKIALSVGSCIIVLFVGMLCVDRTSLRMLNEGGCFSMLALMLFWIGGIASIVGAVYGGVGMLSQRKAIAIVGFAGNCLIVAINVFFSYVALFFQY